MRRMVHTVTMAAVVALAAAGCGVSGTSDGAATPTTATSAERTTTTTEAEAAATTTAASDDPGSGEPASWDEVVAVAGAQHGRIERFVGIVDGSGELATPSLSVAMGFDGDQEVVHATVLVPEGEGSTGGTIEYLYAPDGILMAVDSITGTCPTRWLEMGDLLAEMASEAGIDPSAMAQIPTPPFDLLVDHDPVEGTVDGGATVFAVEIPAALLVSASISQEDPDHWAELEAMPVPAELRLLDDGSLEVEAFAPIEDVVPPSERASVPDDGGGYEMWGAWTLRPSEEPIGIDIPTETVTMDDPCVNG